jgi:hypothetical protein
MMYFERVNRLDINILNSFLGYGDFRNADMLVLSKHEGANNAFLNQEHNARINHFGLEKEYWLDGTDRLNGYWHSSTKGAGEIKNALINDGGMNDDVPAVVSYPTRILLALEDAFNSNSIKKIDEWFERTNNPLIGKIQGTYDEMYSYNQTTNWKAVLSHYQPHPRQNGTWPYAEFKEAEYKNVFGKAEQPENPSIVAIRKRREEILVTLLKKYPKKLILCTGNYQGYRDSLNNFFEREFQTSLNPFSVNGQHRGLHGKFSYEGQKTVVVHTHGFGQGGGLSYDDVRKITKVVYKALKE